MPSSKKRTIPESPRTPGEIAFEKYLNFQHIPFDFEKEHLGKSKRPDFTIEWEGRPIVFDVKDFDPPDSFPRGFGAFDPYPPIREKIAEGRKKFKEYKEYCCGLGKPLKRFFYPIPATRRRLRSCCSFRPEHSPFVPPTKSLPLPAVLMTW